MRRAPIIPRRSIRGGTPGIRGVEIAIPGATSLVIV